MARRISTHEDIVQILSEWDSDPEDVRSESNYDFIPQGDASESEDNLKLNSEESDIASGAESDANSHEDDEFIAKSGKVCKSSAPPVTSWRSCNIVTGSSGPTRITNNATTMQEVFNLFFDGEIVSAICTYTNIEAARVIKKNQCKCCFKQNKNLDKCRFCGNKSIFGVLLIAGALHCRKEAISEM